jgi:hypothetical protein
MITQRIANKFPLETKLRGEPGSVGQILVRPLGDLFDLETKNLILEKDKRNPFSNFVEKGLLWIEPVEGLTVTRQANGTLLGEDVDSIEGDGHTIEQVRFVEDLFYRPVTRIQESSSKTINNLIWDSVDLFNPTQEWIPNKLTIKISGSSKYDLYDRSSNRLNPLKAKIRLTGYDKAGFPISDSITIPDDGYAETVNVYWRLEKVEWEGFDGDIEISCIGFNKTEVRNPYKLGALSEKEGPLFLRNNEGVLEAYLKLYLRGEAYRNVDITDNKLVLGNFLLRDTDGTPAEITDFTLDPTDGRLIVLSGDKLLYYDFELPEFTVRTNASRTTSVVAIPTQYYVMEGTTDRVLTFFRQASERVLGVKIKRVSPTGVETYLQSDLTWGAEYEFPGRDDAPKKSWKDLRFESTYDESGQWDYVLTIRLGNGTTETTVTSVMALTLIAIKEFALESSKTGLGWLFPGRLYVTDGELSNEIETFRDYALINYEESNLYLSERYDEVVVTL